MAINRIHPTGGNSSIKNTENRPDLAQAVARIRAEQRDEVPNLFTLVKELVVAFKEMDSD